MGVDIRFDLSTDCVSDLLHTTAQETKNDTFGGIPNNAGFNVTGDIDFTTVGASNWRRLFQ